MATIQHLIAPSREVRLMPAESGFGGVIPNHTLGVDRYQCSKSFRCSASGQSSL